MKNKTSLAKKLLAILLSLIMAVGVATPAFAMEAVKKIPDVQELKDTIELEKEFLKALYYLIVDIMLKIIKTILQ